MDPFSTHSIDDLLNDIGLCYDMEDQENLHPKARPLSCDKTSPNNTHSYQSTFDLPSNITSQNCIISNTSSQNFTTIDDLLNDIGLCCDMEEQENLLPKAQPLSCNKTSPNNTHIYQSTFDLPSNMTSQNCINSTTSSQNVIINVVPNNNDEIQTLKQKIIQQTATIQQQAAELQQKQTEIDFWKAKATKQKKELCTFCGGTYSSKASLRSHIDKKHSGQENGEEQLPCPNCHKLTGKSNFQRHLKRCQSRVEK